MLDVGAQAPDFTIALGSGQPFTLSEHRGRNVVLFFYPRAFTYGCTVQVETFGDYHADLAASDAVVVGISTDGVDRVRRFGESVGSPFGLGSDSTGHVRRLYDVERRFGLGTSRVTYVIDGEGVVRGVYHNEVLIAKHTRFALETLEGIRRGVPTGAAS